MNTSAKSQPTTAKRWTSIATLRAFVIAAMIGASIYLVGSLVTTITSDSLASPLELQLPIDSISSVFPSDATITDATAQVNVKTGLGYRLAWWAVTDALALVGICFLELLRRIVSQEDDLFTDDNERRLRWMVILSIVFASISMLRPVVSFPIQDSAGFDGLEATWDLSSLALALILAALLEAWRHGVALRTDRDLTI